MDYFCDNCTLTGTAGDASALIRTTPIGDPGETVEEASLRKGKGEAPASLKRIWVDDNDAPEVEEDPPIYSLEYVEQFNVVTYYKRS